MSESEQQTAAQYQIASEYQRNVQAKMLGRNLAATVTTYLERADRSRGRAFVLTAMREMRAQLDDRFDRVPPEIVWIYRGAGRVSRLWRWWSKPRPMARRRLIKIMRRTAVSE
jgi:hypothetical protein